GFLKNPYRSLRHAWDRRQGKKNTGSIGPPAPVVASVTTRDSKSRRACFFARAKRSEESWHGKRPSERPRDRLSPKLKRGWVWKRLGGCVESTRAWNRSGRTKRTRSTCSNAGPGLETGRF